MAESNDGLAAAASESDAPDGQAASAGWTNQQPYDYSFAESQHEWEGNSRVYEWDGEMGAVGPEFPELELELFGPNSTNARHGIDFSKQVNLVRSPFSPADCPLTRGKKRITTIEVFQEGPVRIDPIGLDFKDAGLHPVMQRNIELSGYKVPTPIQRFAIPAISQGYDLISVAQTGSGKTAAYLIPIIGKLMGKAKKWAAPRPNPATYRPGIDPPVRAEPLVVILVPTRELCVQIFNETRKFCYRTMLRPCCVYGGGVRLWSLPMLLLHADF